MGVVIGPAFSMQASGNIGALNFTRWRGMAVARGKTTYTYTPNTLQQTREAVLIAVAKAWGQTLLAEQRAMWGEVAKGVLAIDRFGHPYTMTGYQLYMKLNVQRGMIPLAIQTDPPLLGRPFCILGLSSAAGGGAGYYKIKTALRTGIDEPELIQYWQAGPYDSPGRHALKGEFRLVGVERPASDYMTGLLIIGKWYWFQVRGGMDTGEVGNFHELQLAA